MKDINHNFEIKNQKGVRKDFSPAHPFYCSTIGSIQYPHIGSKSGRVERAI